MRDLAEATLKALTCDLTGCSVLLIASSDISTSGRTSRELAQFVHPTVEWRDGADYDTDPFRSLLDTRPVEGLLGWTPAYTWQRFIRETTPSQI